MGDIANKIKRSEIYHKISMAKKVAKKEKREEVKRKEAAGIVVPKAVPHTLDNQRTHDDTFVDPNDKEILMDEADDEFAKYFSGELQPKIMITTQKGPSGKIFHLIGALIELIPNTFYYRRGRYTLQDICKYASNRGFTHLIVVLEKAKQCHTLLVSHLPIGPTACFRFSSSMLPKDIKGHGSRTSHFPEIILNNFRTRLGRRMGRFLGSLFPHKPSFEGRQVVTFHNQRDFVFFRQHRYMFSEDGTKVRLQELGPRFTLKMRWMLAGTYDTHHGEFEWMHKRNQLDVTKRTFHM